LDIRRQQWSNPLCGSPGSSCVPISGASLSRSLTKASSNFPRQPWKVTPKAWTDGKQISQLKERRGLRNEWVEGGTDTLAVRAFTNIRFRPKADIVRFGCERSVRAWSVGTISSTKHHAALCNRTTRTRALPFMCDPKLGRPSEPSQRFPLQ
jgi:hypothetical protein